MGDYDTGYNAALNDCIGLLRKWFWGTNKEARACEQEIRALAKPTPTASGSAGE